MPSYALTVTVAGQPFDMMEYVAQQSIYGVFFKSAYDAFSFEANVLTKVTDADYPGWSIVTPTSITRASAVATVTLPSAVNWQSGSSVTVAGAAQTEYNGTFVITVTAPTTVTYAVTGTPATPATGTITIKGGRTTVPGVVYLDGYFFVMDKNGVIYNCGLNAPLSWGALDFIAAAIEPGEGVAITKSQNYVVALKEWSTEFFYNAGNATGSPLSPVLSAFTLVGCASGQTVASLDETIYWVAKAKQRGPGVYRMKDLQQERVSTPDVDRILAADGMADCYSYGVKVAGHSFYVLGLRTVAVTLAYDATSNTWAQWTSLTAQAPKSCTIAQVAGIATVTCATHGYSDCDVVTIAGATPAAYNGTWQINVVSAGTFTYEVPAATASPATGAITAVGYTESYFKYSRYVNAAGRDLVLHETSGLLCELSDTTYTDALLPIKLKIRTPKFDDGNEEWKTIGQIRAVGLKQGSGAMIRWSDDDYTTYNKGRRIDLSAAQSRLRRCGKFRRRAFEVIHIAALPVQLSALEIE
jgi:hypothetical protein